MRQGLQVQTPKVCENLLVLWLQTPMRGLARNGGKLLLSVYTSRDPWRRGDGEYPPLAALTHFSSLPFLL